MTCSLKICFKLHSLLKILINCLQIHCLNWSNFKETQIFTASQDGTVKFFDINHPRKTDFIINVDGPVWRAGYTVIFFFTIIKVQYSERIF